MLTNDRVFGVADQGFQSRFSFQFITIQTLQVKTRFGHFPSAKNSHQDIDGIFG